MHIELSCNTIFLKLTLYIIIYIYIYNVYINFLTFCKVLQISWPIKEEEKGGNRGVTDATVSEAFLRMFVETCGHYTEYICVQQNMETVFQVCVTSLRLE